MADFKDGGIGRTHASSSAAWQEPDCARWAAAAATAKMTP